MASPNPRVILLNVFDGKMFLALFSYPMPITVLGHAPVLSAVNKGTMRVICGLAGFGQGGASTGGSYTSSTRVAQ